MQCSGLYQIHVRQHVLLAGIIASLLHATTCDFCIYYVSISRNVHKMHKNIMDDQVKNVAKSRQEMQMTHLKPVD